MALSFGVAPVLRNMVGSHPVPVFMFALHLGMTFDLIHMLNKLNPQVIILRNDYGVPDLGDGHMLSKLNLQVIILKNNYGGPKLGDGLTF